MKKLVPILILFSAWLAGCRPSGVVALEIQDAWARPAAAGQNSAIYLTILNPSGTEDSLTRATVSIAKAAELHQSMEDSSGVMSMHPQHAVVVPARGMVEFSPGGLHIMLIEVSQELKPGDTFNLVLDFQQAGVISLPISVKNP